MYVGMSVLLKLSIFPQVPLNAMFRLFTRLFHPKAYRYGGFPPTAYVGVRDSIGSYDDVKQIMACDFLHHLDLHIGLSFTMAIISVSNQKLPKPEKVTVK